MQREARESQSNGSASSLEVVESGSPVDSEKESEMDPAIWEEIERSESYLVCSMYEEAASLASSILKRLSKHTQGLEAETRLHFELYQISESAGMVLVQSFKQLGRTQEILGELKLSFASVPTIPVQVLLTGVCFYISEGNSLGTQELLEEFLSGWSFVDEQYYVLVGTEENAEYTERNVHFVLGVDKYLEVAEVYVFKLLGTILNVVDLATSWVENAKLPEDRRQVFLRRLHSLHSVKATNTSFLGDKYNDLSPCSNHIVVPDGYSKAKYGPNGETPKQAVFNMSKRLEPCIWWFRTITLKFGSARVVISNGKIVVGILIVLIYYVFKRKKATLKRVIQRQALSMKNALVDLWQLAFSYQVNPLAAVQPLAAATRTAQ